MRNRLLAIAYRMLKWIVVAILICGFAQAALPLDIAILFAGDTFLYFEIATTVWLAAQVTRMRPALAYARIALALGTRRLRRRARRLMRAARGLIQSRGSDEDRGWGALVPA